MRYRCSILYVIGISFGFAVAYSAQCDAAERSETNAYEAFALTHAGDAERGRELYFNEKLTKCGICHKLDGKGGDAGPDLSAIGGKFDRPHLIESLLEPSRQIVEGFRSSIVSLKSGKVQTGVIKDRTGNTMTLVDVNGEARTIEISDIDQQQETDVSLMPFGLEKLLTLDEFADLIAFLETCRTGIKGTPGSHISGGISLPDAFQIETIATGLTGATAMEATADGRILICEQTGALRVVRDEQVLPVPVLTLPVEAWWERGLIGVTINPDFPNTPYIYVCYVAKDPYPHHRISRFTMLGDVADPDSEKLLLAGDDQTTLGGKVPAGHQGGALHFGPDGKLYIAIGEQTAGLPSQHLDTFQGKLLRINSDGSIPDDNPFNSQTTGKYRAIWAIGLRNPFTFAFQPSTGKMYINDIGGNKFEEINLGLVGANYGWPLAEGPSDDQSFSSPIHWYKAASACGAAFVPDHADWPEELRGRYIFADYIHGWIKTLDLNDPQNAHPFIAGLRNPVDLRFVSDGSLYILIRNAWVLDEKFPTGTGSLLKISPKNSGGDAD